MKLGQVLEEKNIITPDEAKQFSELEKIFSQMQCATSKKKAEAKRVQELIDAPRWRGNGKKQVSTIKLKAI